MVSKFGELADWVDVHVELSQKSKADVDLTTDQREVELLIDLRVIPNYGRSLISF